MKSLIQVYFLPLLFFLTVNTACTGSPWSKTLPPTSELEGPRGLAIARTIIHLHSPYSHDACDKNGLPDGTTPEPGCLADLRSALCLNHIDMAFLTDHPSHMDEFNFQELLLYQSGDTLSPDGTPYLNRMSGCADGHVPMITVGFEGTLMTLGMKQHSGATQSERRTLYTSNSAATVTTLKTDTEALVVSPHTESWSTSDIASFGLDAIEIYNFHANLDPKIRKNSLGLSAYEIAVKILPYIYNLYSNENPDFAFISLLQWADVYRQKWDVVLGSGVKIPGVAGSDSHQNAITQKVSDGERVDSHRRILRWFSNHVLVSSRDFDSIKTAIRNGNSWVAFEAFGSPVGMDYFAKTGSTTTSVGGTHSFSQGQTTLNVSLPRVHSSFIKTGAQDPVIRITLKKIDASGTQSTVASSVDTSLTYTPTQGGIYRVEVTIAPKHLSTAIHFDRELTNNELPWIITNPIYLE